MPLKAYQPSKADHAQSKMNGMGGGTKLTPKRFGAKQSKNQRRPKADYEADYARSKLISGGQGHVHKYLNTALTTIMSSNSTGRNTGRNIAAALVAF